MADNLYKLSEEDIAVIQAMKAQLNGVAGNPRLRRPPRTDDFQTNEVYVAQAPEDGLPALSGTTPGTAQCSIYQIINGILKLVTPVKTVYNVGTSLVPEDGFFPVVKDKWGSWLATQGTGGGEPYVGPATMMVANNTLVSIPQYGILEVDMSAIHTDPGPPGMPYHPGLENFLNQPILFGELPTTIVNAPNLSDIYRPFVVLLEPLSADLGTGSGSGTGLIPDVNYGRAAFAGAVQCQVDFSGGVTDWAISEAGNVNNLVACREGIWGACKILWAGLVNDSGIAWAVILMPPTFAQGPPPLTVGGIRLYLDKIQTVPHGDGSVIMGINVDRFLDSINGLIGFLSANIVITYDPTILTLNLNYCSLGGIPGIDSSFGYTGYFSSAAPGQLNLFISGNGQNIYSSSTGGLLAEIGFDYEGIAYDTTTQVLIEADTSGGQPMTYVSSNVFVNYPLIPAPADSTFDPLIDGTIFFD